MVDYPLEVAWRKLNYAEGLDRNNTNKVCVEAAAEFGGGSRWPSLAGRLAGAPAAPLDKWPKATKTRHKVDL